MAQSPIQRAAARSASAPIQPVPPFTLPPLPEKIARIDAEGHQKWIDEVNQTIADWVSRVNAANQNSTGG